jgi:hypothetical protein
MLGAALLLAALAACAHARDFTLYSLKDSHPEAQCSDGSPAGYYFAPSASNSTTWIVFLEGGGCA